MLLWNGGRGRGGRQKWEVENHWLEKLEKQIIQKYIFIKKSFQVYFAGDVHSAKESVVTLIRGLGFVPVDRGGLRSGKLERSYENQGTI